MLLQAVRTVVSRSSAATLNFPVVSRSTSIRGSPKSEFTSPEKSSEQVPGRPPPSSPQPPRPAARVSNETAKRNSLAERIINFSFEVQARTGPEGGRIADSEGECKP